MIVEGLLRANEIKIFSWPQNFVESCLSFFGNTVNPDFNLHEIECYSNIALSPEQILLVWNRDEILRERC